MKENHRTNTTRKFAARKTELKRERKHFEIVAAIEVNTKYESTAERKAKAAASGFAKSDDIGDSRGNDSCHRGMTHAAGV